jgi:peptide/nickel transport system ATP-binding protein
MSTNTPTSTNQEPILEAVHLRKEFPLHTVKLFGPARVVHAVEDASLALRPGRATALVGESGSGKTTVARLLARIYTPTAGTIRYREEVVKARGAEAIRAYRRHVQMVFQDPFSSLNPMHTVRYHLSRPLHIHGHVHSAVEETQLITSLLERVNLTPAEQFMHKFPHQLSGGQRQRVAIARALAAKPSVLLADEPVSMLDVSIRLDMLNLLLRLKEEENLALLFITHDLASARYFAEETLVMYAGQMVEGGPSEEVIKLPKHPYTQLLLSAAPDPERFGEASQPGDPKRLPWAQSTQSAGGSGEPPSLINPPSGCRFHPRCPYAMPVCRQQFPPRTELGGGHWTNCFLYGAANKTNVTEPVLGSMKAGSTKAAPTSSASSEQA